MNVKGSSNYKKGNEPKKYYTAKKKSPQVRAAIIVTEITTRKMNSITRMQDVTSAERRCTQKRLAYSGRESRK